MVTINTGHGRINESLALRKDTVKMLYSRATSLYDS